MAARGVLISVFLAIAAAVPAQAEAPMKRLTLRQDLLGWEAVGRVEIGEKGYCTGVLIAPDLVLTAAHCLTGRDGKYVAPTSLRFRAGLSDGVALAESAVSRVVVHPRYAPRAAAVDRIRYDAGLMRLETPVSLSAAAPFTVGPLSGSARSLSVVSYGAGRSDALSWDESCNVVGRDDGLIAFDCDVTFGSSGAPVFHRDGGRATIVSLVSSGVTDLGAPLAFGMELPTIVAELNTALRRGEGAARRPDAATFIAPIAGEGKLAQPGTIRGGAKFLKP